MNLKIGGSNVGKIMYNGQEFGGATKLEPGTILYMSDSSESTIKNLHLLSTTKNWNNINGIKVIAYNDFFSSEYVYADIPSDDFKNLDITKTNRLNNISMHISTSIVDGEYRLNFNTDSPYKFIVSAL